MATKKFNLALSVVKRFVRVFVAQVVIYVPAALAWLQANPEVAKLVSEYVYWAIPVLSFLASLVVSMDKFRRELMK